MFIDKNTEFDFNFFWLVDQYSHLKNGFKRIALKWQKTVY